MRRSHHAASSRPPATHQPSTAAMTGFDSCRRVGPSGPLGRRRGQVRQVGAGAEGLLVAGEHRDACACRRPRRRAARRAAAPRCRCRWRCAARAGRCAPAGPPAPSTGRSPDATVASDRAGGGRARRAAGCCAPRSGDDTRPTSDRVREAMFNALGASTRSRARAVVDLLRRVGRARHRGAVTRCRPATLRRVRPRRAVGHRGQPAHAPGWPTGPPWCPATRSPTSTRPRARFDLILADPPYAFDGWPALAAAAVARLAAVGPAGRRIGPGARPRRARAPSSGRSGTAVRWWCSPVDSRTPRSSGGNPRPCARWHEPGDLGPVPGVVRPDPQRPPRDHRGRVHALRRGHRRRDAQPAEGRADVRPRGAQGDARGVGRAPRQRRASRSSRTLVVDLAKEVGADFIVKGLRAVSDFESEMQQAQMNHAISGRAHGVHPVGVDQHSFVASKLIREIARFGGDVSSMVPAPGREAARREVPAGDASPTTCTPQAEERQTAGPRAGRELHGPGVEALLRRVSDLIGSARPMPLSASVDDQQGRGPRAPRRGDRPAARGAARGPLAAEGARGVPRQGPAPRATRSSRPPAPGPSAWCSAPRS